MRSPHQKSSLFSFLIVAILSFSSGFFFHQTNETTAVNTSEEAIEGTLVENNTSSGLNFELFNEVWDILQNKYVHPEVFSEKDPFEWGMIKGLVSGLDDPFSEFMTPEENKGFRESLAGNFQGIGAELTTKSGVITVVTPLKGSPAKKAGLMPEDIIIKVDKEEIRDLSLTEVVKKIRGEKGTEVILTVFRPDITDTLDVNIIRDVITLASVESEMKDGNIAYIEINKFGDDTARDFAKQFAEMIEQKPKGIILDLRFNGGGYLDAAVDISSAFLHPNLDVVQVKSKVRKFSHKSSYKSYSNTDIPVIVLINKGSASASEIVAGALQDHRQAVILGEVSFGKGTVQEVIPLKSGASIRVTIAEWLTPHGKTIHKIGITPDVLVKKEKEDYKEEKTPQLDRAMEILETGNWQEFLGQNLKVKEELENKEEEEEDVEEEKKTEE